MSDSQIFHLINRERNILSIDQNIGSTVVAPALRLEAVVTLRTAVTVRVAIDRLRSSGKKRNQSYLNSVCFCYYLTLFFFGYILAKLRF